MKLNAQALVCAAAAQLITLSATSVFAQPLPPESTPPESTSPEVPAPAPAQVPSSVQPTEPPAASGAEADVEDDVEIEAAAPSAPPAPPAPSQPPAPAAPATNDVTPKPAPETTPNNQVEATATPVSADEETTAAPTVTTDTAAVSAPSILAGGNRGAAFDLRPYSRPVLRGFGYGGFVQGQFISSQLSEDQLQQGNAPLNRDQFSVRAARLRLEQGYEYTAFGLELDASTARSQLLSVRRAEATLLYRGDNEENIAPLIALSAGIIDIPFGFEVAEAVRTRLFMERSLASSALFPTQNDVGIRLFGAWKFARYAFAFINGEPFGNTTWPSDPNAAKDLVGRLGGEGDITEKIHLAGGASFAFGKGFHAGRPAVKDSLFWRDDNLDGIATPSEIVGVPGSSASPSANFDRFALGADLALQVTTPLGGSRVYGELYVAQNHDRGLVVSNPIVTGVDVRQWGGYVAFSQDITKYAVVGLRVDLYNPNADVFDQRRGNFHPATQRIITWSPAVGLVLPQRARLLAQYDLIDDYLARDLLGVPTDAKNNQLTVRLQVEL